MVCHNCCEKFVYCILARGSLSRYGGGSETSVGESLEEVGSSSSESEDEFQPPTSILYRRTREILLIKLWKLNKILFLFYIF